MAILDFHSHLGSDEVDGFSQTPEELLGRMDEAGIDRSVVFAYGGSSDPLRDNEMVLESAARYPRLIPFWVVVPNVTSEQRDAQLDVLRTVVGGAPAIRGIVLYPTMHTFRLTSQFVQELCAWAGANHLPIVVHMTAQWSEDCGPLQALARAVPECNFIVPAPFWIPAASVVLRDSPNVYFDTGKGYGSFQLQPVIDDVGVGRIVFGTESPKMDSVLELEKLRAHGLSPAELAAITSETGARLLHEESR